MEYIQSSEIISRDFISKDAQVCNMDDVNG